MASVLESVEWGAKALGFLDQPFKRINRDKPAAVYLRHSKAGYASPERQIESPKDGLLTQQGVETSQEFGERLPNTFSYRIFHSEYPRAAMTAENIHRGIVNRDGDSRIVGSQPFLMFSKSDETQITRYLNLNRARVTDFLTHWISGRYPPEHVEPSLELAQESARRVTENLGEAKPGSIDIYVNHDIIILPIMFHWFGVYHAYPWAGHLDGFILQLYEDEMRFIDKEGEHTADYPHWWTFRP